MRRLVLLALLILLAGSAVAFTPEVRLRIRAFVRPEPPPPITPVALTLPSAPAGTAAPILPRPSFIPTIAPVAPLTPTAAARPTPLVESAVSPTTPPIRAPVIIQGRPYTAYIPAATKPGQFYQYSCEFDAAWVILATYGIDASGEEIISAVEHDRSVEPYIEETGAGFIIHGGDITAAYSGDYTKNFLARSTATAIRAVFERYGLGTTLVHDRAGIEAALDSGALVWIKSTVDFKPWRPAIWTMPDGRTHRTVLGNDHAVVVIGYHDNGVVIRDVLGPTSTNQNRPYEYEVDWATFLAVWEAQSFDGLAVIPPTK
ncbi:MAG: hypothetical protein OHK0015_12480 [Chloroflexi bacterium OHK40]